MIRSFEIPDADLVISSSHCVAKMIRKPKGAKHWCYLYTPMRYIWDLFDEYFGPHQVSWPVRLAAQLIAPKLRANDLCSNRAVDHFVAISKHVASRVERHYKRTSEIIYPPVQTDRFEVVPANEIGDWDLVVSAFVPYKRIDLAIEASNRLNRPLKIIGSGQEEERLRKIAGPQVEFLGQLKDQEVAWHMAHCRSFVFPGEEDFGLTVVEAQAAGRPVVALSKGGAVETVAADESYDAGGVFFDEPNVESLSEALQKVDQVQWDPQMLVTRAQRFSQEKFVREIKRSLKDFTGEELFSDQ